MKKELTNQDIKRLIDTGQRLPFAIENYPSRGQTAVQELYQTEEGKFFLKRVSERNHSECQINIKSGTLAEREYWAFNLADTIGLFVPPLWLLDEATTVQVWFDYPDARTFKESTGKMELVADNIFDCVVFDWITGQIDRHDANYLYDYKDQLVVPVDSAHAFLKYEGSLPDYLHLFEVGHPRQLGKKILSKVKKRLDNISEENLIKIVPLRDSSEIQALILRKNALLKADSIQDLLDLYRGKI